MLHTLESRQSLADDLLGDTRERSRDTCCHRVVQVVLACERQLLLLHIEGIGGGEVEFVGIGISHHAIAFTLSKGIQLGMDAVLRQLALDDGVIVPEDEGILIGLVLQDAELGIHILLHIVVVAVEMVGSDVEQDGDIGTELIHIVELETAEFDDIPVIVTRSHLIGQALTYVACQAHVIACALEDVVDERCGGSLTITTRDTHHLGIGVASGKLNLRDYRNALLGNLAHHGRLGRYARALDHLVGIEDKLLGVLPILPCDMVFLEHLLVVLLNLRHVREEHVETLFLCQDSSTYAALASA